MENSGSNNHEASTMIDQTTEKAAEKAKEYTDKARERIGEYAEKAQDQARERIGEYAEKAQDQVEGGREKVASGIDQAAMSARSIGEGATDRVAGKLDTAADYLHETQTKELLQDATHYVRQHPWRGVMGAIFAGFVIGRIFR